MGPLLKTAFLAINIFFVSDVKGTEENSNEAPVANFSCVKTGIQKISCESSSLDDHGIVQYLWTLDDGATYSSASFEHTFTRPQDVNIEAHAIKLKVFDSDNLSNELEKNIVVDLEALIEAPRGYFKVSLNGNQATLSSFIIKTQFPIKESHPNEGYYLTTHTYQKLNRIIARYKNEVAANSLSYVELRSTAASLKWGGLYDIDKNWKPSHKGHRIGTEIDLSTDYVFGQNPVGNMKLAKKAFLNAIVAANLGSPESFPFPGDRENPRSATKHWHVYLNQVND